MAQTSETARVVGDLKSRLEGVAKNLVFEVYGPDGMPWGTAFSELEDVSVELGRPEDDESETSPRSIVNNTTTPDAHLEKVLAFTRDRMRRWKELRLDKVQWTPTPDSVTAEAGIDSMAYPRGIHIIVEQDDRGTHWTAWFEDDPDNGRGGSGPIEAVKRLLELNPTRLPRRFGIRAVDEKTERTRREFILYSKEAAAVCAECSGTGKYVGLNVVENCAACGGSGVA